MSDRDPVSAEARVRDALEAYTDIVVSSSVSGAAHELPTVPMIAAPRRRLSAPLVAMLAAAAVVGAVVGVGSVLRDRRDVHASAVPGVARATKRGVVPPAAGATVIAVREDATLVALRGDGTVARTFVREPLFATWNVKVVTAGDVILVGAYRGCDAKITAFSYTQGSSTSTAYDEMGYEPALSSDGKRFAWVTGAPGCPGGITVHVRDLDAGPRSDRSWSLRDPAAEVRSLSWSPLENGLTMVVQGQEDSRARLLSIATSTPSGSLDQATDITPLGVLHAASGDVVAVGTTACTLPSPVGCMNEVERMRPDPASKRPSYEPLFGAPGIVVSMAGDAERTLLAVARYENQPDGSAIEHDDLYRWDGPGSRATKVADGVRSAAFVRP